MKYDLKKLQIGVLFLLLLANPKVALTEIIRIEFTEFDTYSREIVHINVGDTVEWYPTNEGHNVEFIITPRMASSPEKSKMNEFYSQVFKVPGIYLYGCTPHLNTGMLGVIVVGDDFHNFNDTEEIDLSPVAKSVLRRLVTRAKSGSEGN